MKPMLSSVVARVAATRNAKRDSLWYTQEWLAIPRFTRGCISSTTNSDKCLVVDRLACASLNRLASLDIPSTVRHVQIGGKGRLIRL
jgi:hypothetical protein